MAPIEGIVEALRTSILAAKRNPTILEKIAPYGYDVMGLDAALLQCDETLDAITQYDEVEALRKVLQERHAADRQEADEHLDHDKQVLKTVFAGNPEVLGLLLLNQARVFAYARWRRQSLALCDKLISHVEWHAALAARGCPPWRFEKGKALVEQVDISQKAVDAQISVVGEARRLRDARFQQLKNWKKEFARYLKLACRKHPELIAEVGLKSMSRARKSKTRKPTPTLPLLPPPPSEEPVAPIVERPQMQSVW